MAFESWLAEKAREELEVLEAKHPSRFHRLKLELQSLISHPDSCAQLFFCPASAARDDDDNALSFTPTSTAPTQVSSNRKRKIKWREEEEQEGHHRKNKEMKASAAARVGDGSGKKSRSSSVEAAIRRAEACLEMIRKVKQNLFC
ncbi:uncharacterized protein LOC121986766 [Zingiber officinale]|uniref:Uncharacterized protein n=1 Tax=Zingiber officinale TaxID=94328 RepID=A0A8J5GPG0_ZINOF|nr:uncharacterized protein LOC121986766 [Zingiber officinale]KAG6503657.1 hypothetical protein ZIOFF_035975 [Zingiber officinale]